MNTTTPAVPETHPRRTRDREATERRMREAAVALFTQHGYEDVTVRMIAAEAQVNIALINRYFGSKLNLFAAALEAESQTPDFSGTSAEDLPRALANYAVRPRTDRPALRAVSRSTCSPEVRELVRRRIEGGLVEQIAAKLSTPDAVQRARTATTVLIGASVGRTVFGQHDLPEDDLAERLTAVLRTCLFGEVG